MTAVWCAFAKTGKTQMVSEMLEVDLTKATRSAPRMLASGWKSTLVAVGRALFVLVFKYYGEGEIALPLWGCIAALLSTLITKWRLRDIPGLPSVPHHGLSRDGHHISE